ncbi:hypothetical protein [Rhizobium sp. AG855]|uniref:hypothetical protein n=1 Tax=Rhizobium sp. AG855 TaxID=2183898 RepID=UPI000E770DA0|nr:hypothetical protein [Rhizobium sp. AG855]RKE85261.1 hypothetical protein DFO46_2057 [Rhizobium sp. AG855]
MNRFATMFSATALTAIAFGADAYAAMPATAMASPQQIENTITKLSPSAYNVIWLDSLKTHDAAKEQFGNVKPTSQEARLVQASVIANPALARKLQADKVELENIVGAQQAADGSVTFYLR